MQYVTSDLDEMGALLVVPPEESVCKMRMADGELRLTILTRDGDEREEVVPKGTLHVLVVLEGRGTMAFVASEWASGTFDQERAAVDHSYDYLAAAYTHSKLPSMQATLHDDSVVYDEGVGGSSVTFPLEIEEEEEEDRPLVDSAQHLAIMGRPYRAQEQMGVGALCEATQGDVLIQRALKTFMDDLRAIHVDDTITSDLVLHMAVYAPQTFVDRARTIDREKAPALVRKLLYYPMMRAARRAREEEEEEAPKRQARGLPPWCPRKLDGICKVDLRTLKARLEALGEGPLTRDMIMIIANALKGIFFVEKVLDSRTMMYGRRAVRQVRIQWEGYADPTWEPYRPNAELDAIKAYVEEHPDAFAKRASITLGGEP